MKRIWIGVGILLGLLAAGILVMRFANRQVAEVSEALQQAAEARDWDRAVSLTQKAREDWKRKRHLIAALADHADLDQIEEIFAQLAVYQHHHAETDHAAACAQLSEAINDLAETHKLTWWNLL